jgi:signal transduction histidine kinase
LAYRWGRVESMNFSVDKITLLAIGIPMIALLLVVYISYQNTIQFIQRDNFADRINLIIQRLEHLITTITDAETGQRGFIITNRVDYLDPYNSALREVHGQLANLGMLMANEPINQQISSNELNTLKALVQAKLDELNQTITLRQSHGLDAALPIILSDRGKILMEKIRSIGFDLQSQLNGTLSNVTTKTQAYAKTITSTTIAATLVAAGIIGVSLFAINRGIHKRHLTIQRSLETEVRKRTEELQIANSQLLVANEQLKLNGRMQQEFINIAAHELRTPAQSILGYVELVKADTQYTEKQVQSFIEVIYRNAFRIQKLTKDVLDVTRIESHTLRLDKIKFNLEEVIQHAIEDTKHKFVPDGHNNVKLEFKKRGRVEEVVSRSKGIFVVADKDRVTQVISNLLDNALKFTTEGVVSVDLAIEKEYKERKGEEEMAVVSIQDTGSGIDPEIFPRLFTKFSSKSFSGTGLGLYISKNIIESHGGKIWAQNSDQGKCGATFYFSLPLAH